jgi:very-short-patch-repair endonuclease
MAAATNRIDEARLSDAYKLAVFHRLAEVELESNEIGFQFTTAEMDDLRANFQRLDRRRIQSKQSEIASKVRQRMVPEGNGKGRVGEYTELSLIRHEIGKKSRHCKTRELMGRAGNAVQALKPCFLMSPLSLARYLPAGGIEFDMVIMDEASQIKPEDAIGAILRAKQLVVVGDPKQLPPTSFFDSIDDEIDDDDATQFDNAESVLEVAQRSFQPYRRLRWHYRSQHENLIQFSNVKFYDEDLVVFPSPSSTMCSLGVVYHHVEGATCVKGENLREAQRIVERIVEHAKQRTGESLGVATFNKKQTEMIDTLVLKACESDPEFAMLYTTMREGDDGFFVKNLENIQGDERDVIFISYTYGRGPTSTAVAQRFGPINTAMGWRRLNVMVTRARKRMEVFSSMHPSDIHGGPDKSRGVNAYRDFLEYASQGLLRETGSESGREPGSPFEESVAKVVESYGLEAVFQVGVAGYFIDIGVRRRQGDRSYLLGIECDGATYHSSRSARDRDRLREEIIQGRGWDLYRIWSTDWFLNQKAEEERLVKRLQQCIA